MEEIIIAATEYGMSNNDVVPLIYFLKKSDIQSDPFNNEPFFKKGFQFVIASAPSALVFIFKSSKEEFRLQVDRKNILNFEKLGYQNFEAKKTSSAAAALRRATAVTGSGGLIPVLAVQGISKWLTGNKSEIHEGQIFSLNYQFESEKIYIKIACEKTYEHEFDQFLIFNWTSILPQK
jgi:hypothetical protein